MGIPKKIGKIGIYRIEWHTGHYYYGQTVHYKNRIEKHISEFLLGSNSNSRMQRVYKKYGMPHFEFIQDCTLESIDETEQRYLDEHCGRPLCCNILKFVKSNRGFKMPSYFGKLLAERNRKMIFTPEIRAKMSASAKVKYFSPEHRRKIGEAAKGGLAGAKMVFNPMTGIFYNSLLEASFVANYTHSHFAKMLKGKVKNKTSFIYA